MKPTLVRCTALAFASVVLAACGKPDTAGREAEDPARTSEESARAQPGSPQAKLIVLVDRDKAAALGVSTGQIGTAIAEAFGDRPIPGDADLTKINVRSFSGNLVPLSEVARVTLAESARSGEASDATFLKEMKNAPADAQPVGTADDPAAYEAWFKKHNLDLADPAMLAADADGDGVSNRDEFLAGTNPRDAASNSGTATAHPAIRFKEYNEVRLPLVLESVSGDRAVIRRSDGGEIRNETVREGETLRGFPLRVTKLSERQTTDKDGGAVDRSQVLLEDTSTKERVTLVKNLPAKTSATYALLVSEDGKTSVKVHAGEVFTWPGEAGASYQVLDLGRDQIVLQQQGTRKMWTIPRQ